MNESQPSLPQAQLAFEQGRYKEAVQILLALVEHSEHPGEAYLWLAMSWDAMGETRQAIDFLRSLNIQDVQVREQKDRLLTVMEALPLPRQDQPIPSISARAEPHSSNGACSTSEPSIVLPARTETTTAVQPVLWAGGLIALGLAALGFVLWWLLG